MTSATDNRTTELRISEPLRGFIRHQSNRAYIDGGQARWLTEIADKIDAKHEQAIAVTLGSGTCHERTCHIVTTWCDSDYLHDVNYRCSECGGLIVVDERNPDDYFEIISHANYCCNCGAKVLTP